MAVPKKTRFEVFKRDGFRCGYCGKTPPAVTLEVDHIEPVANGGEDDLYNLITACFDCNRGKRDIPQGSGYVKEEILRGWLDHYSDEEIRDAMVKALGRWNDLKDLLGE